MSIPQGFTRNKATDAILSGVRISDICQALTGIKPQHGRIPAPWRNTQDRNVSLHDGKGAWFDHVTNEGGGVLDLVARVRGGSRQDALRWVADFAGIPVEDTPLSAADRAKWARQRRELERDLPAARYWKRSAIAMGEGLLVELKSQFFDATSEISVSSAELRDLTRQLERWQGLDGADLVNEFHAWRDKDPELVAGMVHVARMRETAERRAILRYLMETSA